MAARSFPARGLGLLLRTVLKLAGRMLTRVNWRPAKAKTRRPIDYRQVKWVLARLLKAVNFYVRRLSDHTVVPRTATADHGVAWQPPYKGIKPPTSVQPLRGQSFIGVMEYADPVSVQPRRSGAQFN
jgi:hypothetical protein